MKNSTGGVFYEKTSDGEVMYDVFSRMVKDRVIFLSEDIETECATTLSATLLLLNSQSKTKPINLYINSIGGHVLAGMFTIYDTMQYISAPIHTVCIGVAYSAAALLLAAGEKRKAFHNSEIMIHNCIGGVDPSGDVKDNLKNVKRAEMLNNKMVSIFSHKTGKDEEEIRKAMEETTYFTAQEAKDFGLIDEIVTSEKVRKRR